MILILFLKCPPCSHEDIDVSHPEFFSAAKLNGYTPPNKEVICCHDNSMSLLSMNMYILNTTKTSSLWCIYIPFPREDCLVSLTM